MGEESSETVWGRRAVRQCGGRGEGGVRERGQGAKSSEDKVGHIGGKVAHRFPILLALYPSPCEDEGHQK